MPIITFVTSVAFLFHIFQLGISLDVCLNCKSVVTENPPNMTLGSSANSIHWLIGGKPVRDHLLVATLAALLSAIPVQRSLHGENLAFENYKSIDAIYRSDGI